ncbi:MAG: SH3 domain-containing protein [Desulfovibrionaceae bacterium]|nr:SH3 domain-containing protein [Desulfovibrionaceae bacterium]
MKNRYFWGKAGGILLLLLLLGACGGKEVSWYGPVADLGKFPQNLEAYIQEDESDKPLLNAAEQTKEAERYKRLFFKPWRQDKSTFPPKEAAWAPKHYKGKKSWTADGERLGKEVWDKITANADIQKFPSLACKGILLENAPLRALPTYTPYYRNPSMPGQGYPFDHLAFVGLWTGTPVFVSHISQDREWLFCETALLSGWVPARSVAPVSDEFAARWQALPLTALIKDKVPPCSEEEEGEINSRDLRVGTLLPRLGEMVLLPELAEETEDAQAIWAAYAADAQNGGRPARLAKWRALSLPEGTAASFPLPFTAGNMAAVGNEMLGESYGWGGIDYLRDCSSLMHDLFAVFGIWLPRNSSQQLKEGKVHNISGVAVQGRNKRLNSLGVPFRTLVGMPGHVMLYIGEHQGRAMVYHDIWGARTLLEDGQQGRLIIGQVAITSLEPGIEHEEVRRAGTLLKRIKSFNIIP